MKKSNSAPQAKDILAERAARADLPKALSILKKAGAGKKPVKGDEIA